MKRVFFGIAVACALSLPSAPAQQAQPDGSAELPAPAAAADVEALRRQVEALTELVHALQQQVKDQQSTSNPSGPPQNREQPGSSTAALPSDSATPGTPSTVQNQPQLIPTTDSSVVASAGVPTSAPAGQAIDSNGTAFPTTDPGATSSSGTTISASSTSTSPVAAASGAGKTYLNISFDGQFSLSGSTARDLYNIELGDHDPQQRGLNIRNAEIALDGAVDPYFEGFANIVLKLDNDNETEIELEEAFLQTTSLPFGLQVKAGQFFAAFGRQNSQHPHAWDFVDASLPNGGMLGPDGLRGAGAQISWTVPASWYLQVIFGAQNGRGGTGYSFRNPGDHGVFFGRQTTDREARGLQDFVFTPRVESSFNLNDTQTVLFGVSGAFGSNATGAESRTQIYGADLLYKWKSARAEGGFPFVKWQTEGIYRRFEGGRGADQSFPVAEVFEDWGAYSQILWGFKKGWIAGIRGDHLHMQQSAFTDDDVRQTRSRLSADLTWFPSEFSKLRLQYNHDFLEANNFLAAREVDSIFLQFEFLLGAHGAHKF